MNILILEDSPTKLAALIEVIQEIGEDIKYKECKVFHDLTTELNRNVYDLIIVDLKVPLFHDNQEEYDISDRLLESLKDTDCPNFTTPTIAITQYDQLAEDHFRALNRCGITVITYSETNDEWKSPFHSIIQQCIPKKTYHFIILCALDKEAEAYSDAGYDIGDRFLSNGIICRNIKIGAYQGLIVIPTRMGLVNSAILSARVLELYKPQLICMSGICAGIENKANIYDVIIPEICHQHDSGKWTNKGFIPELYEVQLNHNTKINIETIINAPDFLPAIRKNITLCKNEFPLQCNTLEFNVFLAPTSSGSAVIADDEILANIKAQHRKKTAFEMESYAMYEAARQSELLPVFFSAKAVVDNGNEQKDDEYHRVASILSAKVVYEVIVRGLVKFQ
jgi:nucleoside phosphorylase